VFLNATAFGFLGLCAFGKSVPKSNGNEQKAINQVVNQDSVEPYL